MIKTKSALLYIFITVLFLCLFASFDAESYFDYASALDVSDENMMRAITDDMKDLYIDTGDKGDDVDTDTITEYILNDESPAIKEYKFILYYLDYADYPKNGLFDSDLELAVKNYQTEKLLKVTGILDVETMNALEKEVLTYKEGKYGEAILEYKETLQKLGYIDESEVLTQAFDAELTEVIKAYQRNNKVEESGYFDVYTQIELRKPLENQYDVNGNIVSPDIPEENGTTDEK